MDISGVSSVASAASIGGSLNDTAALDQTILDQEIDFETIDLQADNNSADAKQIDATTINENDGGSSSNTSPAIPLNPDQKV